MNAIVMLNVSSVVGYTKKIKNAEIALLVASRGCHVPWGWLKASPYTTLMGFEGGGR